MWGGSFWQGPLWDEAGPSTPVIGALCGGKPQLASLKRVLVKVLLHKQRRAIGLLRGL